MLSLSFDSRYPDRVRSLALVACGTYDQASRASYRRALDERLGPEGRERWSELAHQVATARTEGDRDAAFAALGRLAADAEACDALPEEGDNLRADSRGFEQTWSDALRLQSEGVEPRSFRAIKAPVLMLHGADDPHPGAMTRDRLRLEMPQVSYEELSRCGHIPWAERRAREPFLDRLAEWFRSSQLEPR
jgi:pimeloyl-ACP methyl ester carboxylesterase